MSTVTATIDLADDAPKVVAGLLSQFPKGARLHVAISEVPPVAPVPTLEEYREAVAVARQRAPRSPWKTSAETMQALREGEAD